MYSCTNFPDAPYTIYFHIHGGRVDDTNKTYKGGGGGYTAGWTWIVNAREKINIENSTTIILYAEYSG